MDNTATQAELVKYAGSKTVIMRRDGVDTQVEVIFEEGENIVIQSEA